MARSTAPEFERAQAAGAVATSRIDLGTLAEARRGSATWRAIKHSWQLYVMLLLPLTWLVIFQYVPMFGAQIAFRNYSPAFGITGSKWVGLDNFQRFYDSFNFWPVLRQTLSLSLYTLAAGFPLPIIFALALNYTMRSGFRRSVQMIAYAPHFISTVVMVGIILQMLSTSGLINQYLGKIGMDPINFMGEPSYFNSIFVWSEVWQHLGFSSIIYLAALTAIDPTLHEAAVIDGANKLQRIRDVDLPGIMPVAVILLILQLGFLLSSAFEKVYLMQNPLNQRSSEVIDTYVLRVSIFSQTPQWSYGAAIGLFKAVVGLVLILSANQIARRLKAASLW